MNYTLYTPKDKVPHDTKKEIADFLYEHLDQFGDKIEYIMKCIEFALDDKDKFGGFILTSRDEKKINGAVVVNKTGMGGYIPENILVYIAVNRSYRGKGIGKELMKRTLDHAEGDVKLHVEPENPARFLYEKIGFTSKYLEMRWTRK
ncbi:MAG: GNAT family N-acetyltransferase [Bacteroidales bacterium]|nr:GNAT family N-acetyltransferase [Bacteroidales bacterium]